MKTPGVFIAVFAMYCICALCIGMSSAADVRTDTAHHNSTFSARPGHWLSSDTGNISFAQKNFNASEVKPAPRHINNTTGAECPGNFLPTHPAMNGTGIIRQGHDLTNTTQQQQIISRLEKDGFNVTDFKTELLNGNIDAAKALLDAFMQAHRNTMPD